MSEENELYLCPGCMRPLPGPNDACPVCGWRPDLQGPELCLPVGTTLKGRYILGRGVDFHFSEEMDYPAWDSQESRPVEVREFFHLSAKRGPGGAMLVPDEMNTGWLSSFPAKYPNALDVFRENSTVYVVVKLPAEEASPGKDGADADANVSFQWAAPDLRPALSPELSEAREAPPPAGARVTDPRRVCPSCMYISDAPLGVCPLCGEDARADGPLHTEHELPVGTFLGGKYLVGRPLYAGRELTVYSGLEMPTSRPVSITEFFPSGLSERAPGGFDIEVPGDSGSFAQGAWRLISCAQLYRRFGGTAGVPFFADCFFENGTAYLVAYLERGLSLRSAAARAGDALPPRKLVTILRDIVEAVKVLRLQGGVHAGITPDSVFVAFSGRARLLIPYGPLPSCAAPELRRRWATGFDAPELTERGELTPASDVYSLAATAYAALTRRDPPCGARPDFSSIHDVPTARAIEAGMSPDPAARPGTPEEFLGLLNRGR